MRVFVTGATGFIGTAVVHELLAAGHQVLGLARSDRSAEKLKTWGVDVHRGDLHDLKALAAGASACDGVIHLAFIHDFSQYLANAETDRLATAAMAAALEGSDRPLVVTSSTAVLAPGALGRETDPPTTQTRSVSELVLSAAERGVRVSAVRLAPTVHGDGDQAFVPALIQVARRTGFSAYVGDGANRWPAIHRLDAATLFRLALEKGVAGSRFHGASEEGIPVKSIAECIGEGLNVPVKSITADDARVHFDWLGGFVALDTPASSDITRESLGWMPKHPDLLTDMRENGYFS